MMKERTRFFDYKLAEEFGTPCRAIMFGRIRWSCEYHAEKPDDYEDYYFREGRWWMKDTDEAWANFGPWKKKRAWQLDKEWLKKNGWILVKRFNANKNDQTSFMAINHEKLLEFERSLLDLEAEKLEQDADCASGKTENLPKKEAVKNSIKTKQKPEKKPANTRQMGISHDAEDASCKDAEHASSSMYLQSTDNLSCSQKGRQFELLAESPVPPKAKRGRKANNQTVPSAGDEKAAVIWRERHIKINYPLKYNKENTSLKNLAEQIRKARIRFGFTDDQMVAMVEYTVRDKFWKEVIVMPSGLTTNKDGVRNGDRIFRQMTRGLSRDVEIELGIQETVANSDKRGLLF